MVLSNQFILSVILLGTIFFIQLVSTSDVKTGVKFYLWTKTNPEKQETLIFDDGFTKQDLDASAFNASASTKVFIHGYLKNGLEQSIQDVKDAFLQVSG